MRVLFVRCNAFPVWGLPPTAIVTPPLTKPLGYSLPTIRGAYPSTARTMVSASPASDPEQDAAARQGTTGKAMTAGAGDRGRSCDRTSPSAAPASGGGIAGAPGGDADADAGASGRDEIYSYEAPHTVYALAWSVSWV